MENMYASNSNRSKENKNLEREKLKKIVNGKVVTKNKSKFKRFIDEFISEDAKKVKSYVFGDVLIPAIKKAISDIVTDGIDIILYGESRKNKKYGIASKVSYSSYYDDKYYNRTPIQPRHTLSKYTEDIIVPTRGEAEDVLGTLTELIDTYKIASVADLYDLVGLTCDYTCNDYGWTNVADAEIIRSQDGYIIKMPRAMPLH